jgi:hypothetical protein
MLLQQYDNFATSSPGTTAMNEASASLNRLETIAGIANDGIPHHSPHPTHLVDANRAAAAYMAALPALRKALGDPDAPVMRPRLRRAGTFPAAAALSPHTCPARYKW